MRHGHSEHDLRRKYTIEQVSLYYNRALEEDLRGYRMSTIIAAKANSLYAQYASKKDAQSAFNAFQEFLDSLDPDKIERKRERDERTRKDPMQVFSMFGSMIQIAGDKK